MRDVSFAEILEKISSENETKHSFSTEVSSTLEPAFLSNLLGEIPPLNIQLRVQNHSASPYSRQYGHTDKTVSAQDFKLKSQGMTQAEFKAYETLLYALELPILVAHRLFPECFNQQQLKKVYKLAALKNHPDSGGCHESFLEIKKCYDILEGFVKTKAA